MPGTAAIATCRAGGETRRKRHDGRGEGAQDGVLQGLHLRLRLGRGDHRLPAEGAAPETENLHLGQHEGAYGKEENRHEDLEEGKALMTRREAPTA